MQHKEKIFNISLSRKIKMEIKENKTMYVKKMEEFHELMKATYSYI